MVETPKTDSTLTPPIQRSRSWQSRMKRILVSSVTPKENYGPHISACYLIVRCMLAIGLMLTMNLPSSYGHDAMHPELNPWFAKLRSKSGPCCDGSDAYICGMSNGPLKTRRKAITGLWCRRPPTSIDPPPTVRT